MEKVKILFSKFLISKNKFFKSYKKSKKRNTTERRWQTQIKRILPFVIIIFLTIIIISSYFLIKDILEYEKIKKSSIQLVKQVITKEDTAEIDWQKLEEINKDIIGWIKIENTNINYPILKDNENLKYLNHTFDGKYNRNGAIFTLNNNPFQDKETIIHGHNMKNGIMFSELAKYMKKDFFVQNSIFHIYTKNQNYRATIFSCYSTGIKIEENNIKPLNFKEKIEYYKNSSKYSTENLGEIEKIVKLSTCSYLNSHTTPTNQRYYIIAKLEEVE